MQAAFKEWAVVVDALGRGDQIIIFRKGGISEGKGGFEVRADQFWLFPTLFHQQRESVIGPAQARYDELVPEWPGEGKVPVQFLAKVSDAQVLKGLDGALCLRGQHIWKDEVIRDRFDWGREKEIYVLAVRVFGLPEPVVLEMKESYGGCKSWVELEESLPEEKLKPVLSDHAFEEKMDQFRGGLSRHQELEV